MQDLIKSKFVGVEGTDQDALNLLRALKSKLGNITIVLCNDQKNNDLYIIGNNPRKMIEAVHKDSPLDDGTVAASAGTLWEAVALVSIKSEGL